MWRGDKRERWEGLRATLRSAVRKLVDLSHQAERDTVDVSAESIVARIDYCEKCGKVLVFSPILQGLHTQLFDNQFSKLRSNA